MLRSSRMVQFETPDLCVLQRKKNTKRVRQKVKQVHTCECKSVTKCAWFHITFGRHDKFISVYNLKFGRQMNKFILCCSGIHTVISACYVLLKSPENFQSLLLPFMFSHEREWTSEDVLNLFPSHIICSCKPSRSVLQTNRKTKHSATGHCRCLRTRQRPYYFSDVVVWS